MSEFESRARAERLAAMQGDDAPDIPVALTPSEWTARRISVAHGALRFYIVENDDRSRMLCSGIDGHILPRITDGNNIAGLIALANDALNDEDPRKLRRSHVEALRNVPTVGLSEQIADALHELTELIVSYLPHETP